MSECCYANAFRAITAHAHAQPTLCPPETIRRHRKDFLFFLLELLMSNVYDSCVFHHYHDSDVQNIKDGAPRLGQK